MQGRLPLALRVTQFRQYYQRRNARPLLGFFLGSEYPLSRYPSVGELPADRPLRPDDFDPERLAEDSAHLSTDHEACGGDFIWSATAFWGIPWIEAALGCPLYADHAAGSISTRPPACFSGGDDVPEFDSDSPWMRLAARCLEALVARSAGEWPIGTTRMRGITDLLSALYGPQEYVLAMIDRPGETAAVCERLTEFWIEFARFQLARIPSFYGGIGSFYYGLWAPTGTVWGQEDAAALLSPPLYDRLIRPCDQKLTRAVPNCIIHLHPSGYVPVAPLLAMKLTALELHVDCGGPSVEDLLPLHRTILDRRPLLIAGRLSAGEIRGIFQRLPASGLAVQTMVDTIAEAKRIWQEVFN